MKIYARWQLTLDVKVLNGQIFDVLAEKRDQVKNIFEKFPRRFRHITSENFKILYKTRVLRPESYLSNIFSFKSTSVEMFIVPNQRLPPYVPSQNQLLVIKIFENIFTLIRNVEASLTSCKTNQRPEDRDRFNVPEFPIIFVPSVPDIGDLFIKLSRHVRDLAICMSKFSDLLIRDPKIFENERESHRNFIQNLMDCTRYLSPLLTNVHRLSIRLGTGDSVSQLTTC